VLPTGFEGRDAPEEILETIGGRIGETTYRKIAPESNPPGRIAGGKLREER
jgi:hypothetical protein